MRLFYKLLSLIILIQATCILAGAQVSFSDSTHLLPQANFSSGVAVGIADMNNDGLDDIIRLKNARELHIEYQEAEGSFAGFTFGTLSDVNDWALWVADVDNDGKNDVITAGRYNPVKVIRQQSPVYYEMYMLPGNYHFAQGSNAADINNDGWIDIFSCHDDGESRIWGNGGNGNFKPADDWIDMRTTPASDNSGNYGSIWTDFDNDGDIDLYIAKCRLGVESQTDPRRINALFVNDGRGNYTEMAEAYGLKFGYQAWTSDFQDIDNDGDLDCFITNHDYSVQLLENDGTGHFTDISEAAGLNFSGFILQGIMRDFDNDGFVDILTTGVEKYFHNNGDKTFTEVSSPFGAAAIKSAAVGDLNHDGFLDVYATYHNSYNTPSGISDELWLNNGNDKHYLVITLKGKTANINGIGAKLELYGPWGIQTREVRSGESYGIMNTFKQHFGLDSITVADSLIVKWPSGSIDVFYNLEADQFLEIEENSGCNASQPEISAPTVNYLCPDTGLDLTASNGSLYIWSTGDTTDILFITQAGSYNVINREGNCAVASSYFSIENEPDLTPEIDTDSIPVFCEGEQITLTATESDNYLWSNGAATQSIIVTESGIYSVGVAGDCGIYEAEGIEITVLEANSPTTENDTLFGPGQATLIAYGGNPHWYESDTSQTVLATGDTLITPELEITTTFYVEDVIATDSEERTLGMPTHFGNDYSSNIYNGETFFNCNTHLTLNTVKVYTDQPGLRIIELKDADGNVLQTHEADLQGLGTYILELNFAIPPGEGYVLTTNTENNNAVFGFNSPRLKRNNEGVSYPYQVDEIIEITGSNLGEEFYYYFYDWKVSPEAIACNSERVPVQAVLILDATSEPAETIGIEVYPNPSKGVVQVTWPEHLQNLLNISIMDGVGKKVMLKESLTQNHQEFYLGHLAKGLYYVQFEIDGKMYYSKIVLQ